jgi:hypothetical protein
MAWPDLGPNGYNLTDNNTVGVELRGPKGTVAKFTSADADYLEASGPIIDPTASFSVAGWCYRATQADGGIVNVDNASNRPWNIDVSGNAMRAYPNGGYIAYGPAAPPVGKWFFFCGSVNRQEVALGRVHMWVNGAEGATRDMDGAINATTSTVFRVGTRKAWNDSQSPFRIARLGVWARALSSAEQIALMNNGNGKLYSELTAGEKTGLTAYWDLGEASGNRADSHSGGYTLTDKNTVGSETAVNNAMEGKAASFVAANSESLSVTMAFGPDLVSGFTASGWYKPVTAVANGTVFLISDGASSYIRFYCDGSAPSTHYARFTDGTNDSYATLTGLTNGAWYHFVMWFDPATKKACCSINGAATVLGGAAAAVPTMTDVINVSLGAANTILLDEVAIWRRVLTADERTALYNSGAGKFYPFT